MPRTRLAWRLFGGWCALVTASVAACHWMASVEMARLAETTQVRRMLDAGRAVAEVAAQGSAADPTELTKVAREIGHVSRVVVDFLDADGRPHSGTAASGEGVRQSAEGDMVTIDAAALAEARAGRSATTGRYDATSGRRTVVVTVPAIQGGRSVGIVHLTADSSESDAELADGQRRLLLGSLVSGAAALAAGWVLARRASRPLEELAESATRVADGADGAVARALPNSDVTEVSVLASAVDALRGQLVERGLTIGRQGTQQEAVLGSMIEGVLAVDSRMRIVSINRAAADLLALDPGVVLGRPLQEVVRNADLRQFALQAIDCREPVEDDLVLRAARDRTIRVRGTALRDQSGEGGAVIVLEDITDIRHLENVRRDFVANVSHELKTPVASIKGFVETLLEGRVDAPEDRRRFLEIIARQSDRLGSIIEDLLALSRIEQAEDSGEVPIERVAVVDLIGSVVSECRPRADERSITIDVDCPPDLDAEVNAPLLEQALINLVDNALKYSEPRRTVWLSAAAGAGKTLEFVVRDEGSGIAAEHLPRLFERFYRVDKGRSRRVGGTGLGLSIVKHIVQAHGGTVSVESAPGVGSTFRVVLPASGTK
jgi:two-component system phosphate regulon sensor histidine kinase PhoR